MKEVNNNMPDEDFELDDLDLGDEDDDDE